MTEAAMEEGDPAEDGRAFRRCLGEFATGVTVITAEVGGVPFAVTANSFSSLSLDPPLILWSIARSSRSFDAFGAAEHFAINVLGEGQIDLSQRFSSKETDKFSGVSWSRGTTGAPLLAGATAALECRVEARHEAGDHVLIIGRVKRYARPGGKPLLFVQGRYAVAESHPALAMAAARPEQAPGTQGTDYEAMPLATLIFRAFHYISAAFDDHRRAEGLNIPQGRMLFGIQENPGLTVEELAQKIFDTVQVARDSAADLIEEGYVQRDPAGRLTVTQKGAERRESILRRIALFDSEQLVGAPAEEIEQTRKFLIRLLKRKTPSGS